MSLIEKLGTLPTGGATPAEKLLQALDLHDEGVAMQKLSLRRRFPKHTAEQLERELERWLMREDEAH